MINRARLIERVGLKCADFIRQLSIHRALVDYDLKINFWIYVYNNSIEKAVIDWCHLFGNQKDDLYYNKVIEDEEFENYLLDSLKIDKNEFDEYKKDMRYFRDKDIAHIEIISHINIPDMDIALNSISIYYKVIYDEINNYVLNCKWPPDLLKYYQWYLEKTKIIVELAYGATAHFGG